MLATQQFNSHYATVSSLLEAVLQVPGMKSSHHRQFTDELLRNLALALMKVTGSNEIGGAAEAGNKDQATAYRCKRIWRAKAIVSMEQYRE